MAAAFLYSLKELLGMFYFFTWSATFYPQVVLCFRRKTTSGLSHDFVLMSWVGFVAYATFTLGGFFSTTVRDTFQRESGAPPPIEIADVAFASHAFIMINVLLAQVLFMGPGPRMRRDVATACISIACCVAVGVVLAIAGKLSWVVLLNFCGAVKVITSVLKHFPQAFSNYRRRSTIGFSATMVMLDVFGSLGSFAQQGVRCVIDRSWEPFTGNLSKLLLSIESFFFDLFFLYQHFVLYRTREAREGYRLPYRKIENHSIA